MATLLDFQFSTVKSAGITVLNYTVISWHDCEHYQNVGITKDQVFCKDPKNVKTSHTCFDVKTSGRYFQILMPSNNVLTLKGESFWRNYGNYVVNQNVKK